MCEALHMPVFAMLSEGARVCVHGETRLRVSQDAWMCVCAWLLMILV